MAFADRPDQSAVSNPAVQYGLCEAGNPERADARRNEEQRVYGGT